MSLNITGRILLDPRLLNTKIAGEPCNSTSSLDIYQKPRTNVQCWRRPIPDMTSQFFQGELSTLIQESKRKNSDLRNAAEKSLGELKAVPSTSEVQLAADLVRRPQFANPFILACHTRHAKLAAVGVGCIHRLVASGALPSEQLKDVVDGLHETTNLSLDVQLKVLQTLPSLFQRHAGSLSGQLLAKTLEICATMQTVKTITVANTAAATLQQLVVSVFEKAVKENEAPTDTTPVSVSLGNEKVDISAANYDAFRLLDDLCRLVEGESLRYLSIKPLSKIFVLELIESIFINNNDIFESHPEHAYILRYRLMPLIVRILSERQSFPVTVRVSRILLLLLRSHLRLLAAESEVALSLLIHLLDTDASPPWKRAISMEIFRVLYAEPGLIRLIFRLFDQNEERKSILKDHMACLVRLAAEKPSLIGLSHQSTVPTAPESSGETLEDQVALEAVGVAGVIGSPSTSADACGISSQWSLLRAPYIETLEKLEAPSPPETYIYSLILNCISALSDSIAKFILPLAVAETKSRRRRHGSSSNNSSGTIPEEKAAAGEPRSSKYVSIPLNPLSLKSHPQIGEIQIVAGIIDACWPAVLATSSTFLYAALDGDFYHNLVRAFQRLAHVAGLLRLKTPRDAFLTTLGKAAVPADVVNITSAATLSPRTDDHHLSAPESPIPKSPRVAERTSTFMENQGATLDTRNLLCLRALLNLGIALGPTLDQESWSIILQTLQHADLITGVSATPASKLLAPDQNGDPVSVESLKGTLGNEILAVRTAAAKMLENTQDYPNKSLKIFLLSLLNLSERTEESKWSGIKKEAGAPSSQVGQQTGRIHQTKRSMSIALGRSRIREDELKFVLNKMGELVKSNAERLATTADSEDIWDMTTSNLISITSDEQISLSLRSKASEVLNKLVLDTIKIANPLNPSERDRVQLRGLRALVTEISILYETELHFNSKARGTDFQLHEFALETLKAILEECGDSITAGWDLVFAIISTVFNRRKSQNRNREAPSSSLATISDSEAVLVRSPKLVRTAYDSLQLVASDFLGLLPASCLLELVETFSCFTSQEEDFNISLTTTTFFWNISDFIRGQIGNFAIADEIDVASSEENLAKMATATDSSSSRHALWLLLLLNLVHLATDSRTEIRNSAIQTLLRIFEHYGEQITPNAWHLCLNRVLLMMAESVQQKLQEALESTESGSAGDQKAWTETAVLVTRGFSSLIAGFFDAIIQYPSFRESWSRLLQYFCNILNSSQLELQSTTFASFADVLHRIKGYQDIGREALEKAWSVWVANHPSTKGHDSEKSNQEALLAYLNTYKQLYRLLGNNLNDEAIVNILRNLQFCVWESVTSRYSSDLERQSEVQRSVIECLRTLCSDKPDSQCAIINYLGQFADSALTIWSSTDPKEKPTFVAFSKASMQLLSQYITNQGININVLLGNTLSEAVKHLVNAILHKYIWKGKDCDPPLWQIATTASLDILEIAIPSIEKEYEQIPLDVVANFWLPVVDLTRGIVSADHSEDHDVPMATVARDEKFDIDAFTRLRALIIPSLGSNLIPDRIRRDFAFILLRSSLIYHPQRVDIPLEQLKLDPLKDLYVIRRGRTIDPRPTLRFNLSYLLIDTLFDLVSMRVSGNKIDSQGDAKRMMSYVTLAKSISPYLVLRCGITLKSYIADQPLRGLMPPPMAARKELLHLLKRLYDLRSEPVAIPATGPNARFKADSDKSDIIDDEAKYKKHLEWVYPLVVKGVPIAGREADDREILEALTRILNSVASHFVLQD
ncbi:HEAT repeat containing protein [Coccidioides posadasii C735 delta SOWgp]|uniref:HEAT repeat containing protein n=1 Tax=Coccidioides posadasii (strain C735) TaxID=222929 RepID=C5PG17_COCP7|nr:HEAT repeat containing protein [Coccidioides posadasii C735 delta SOWgp]EER23470.1 HEAT repeat containing protein [Coccidioides posadasii C735 delta SOWgp]|eukprot:XP_003065615.1 HEAT repeat containing protein [Coccidioides posadasii C735 delta SOWgp]